MSEYQTKSKTGVIPRVFVVEFTGSYNSFAARPETTEQTIFPSVDAMLHRARYLPSGSQPGGDPTKGILCGVNIKSFSSTFETPMLLSKNFGQSGHVRDKKGRRGVFVIMPTQGNTKFFDHPVPLIKLHPHIKLSLENFKGVFNPEEVRAGIHYTESTNSFTVPGNSPIMDVLQNKKNMKKSKYNPNLWRSNLPGRDGSVMYNVPKDWVEAAITALEKRYKSEIQLVDLNTASLTINRMNAEFTDPLDTYIGDKNVDEPALSSSGRISIELCVYFRLADVPVHPSSSFSSSYAASSVPEQDETSGTDNTSDGDSSSDTSGSEQDTSDSSS